MASLLVALCLLTSAATVRVGAVDVRIGHGP
jgi:hypothetical protein